MARFYPMDVGVLTLQGDATLGAGAAGTVYNYLDIFQESSIEFEVENETSKAAQDILGTAAGFEFAINKAKGYSIRLGSAVGVSASGVGARSFGWQITKMQIGAVDYVSQFKLGRVGIQKMFGEARAAGDTVVNYGWKFPRATGNRFSLELESVIDVDGTHAAGLFDTLIDNTAWQSQVAYAFEGFGNVAIDGLGTLAGGSFGHTMEESSARLMLSGFGKPSTVTSTDARNFFARAMGNGTFQVVMTRPGGTAYTGHVYLEEATMEAPIGACLQNATLRGYGPIAPT